MNFLTDPSLAPWLPPIFLITILLIGFILRLAGGDQAVTTPPPPLPHSDGAHH
jgi:hypothetical protein